MTSIGNKEVFAENLTRYTERSGKTQKELAELVGVAQSTFNDWCKGKKYPRIDKIEILSKHFGILKSDLIERKTESQWEMQKKNDTLSDIVVRMRTDSVFCEAVEALYKMDADKLSGFLTLMK